MDLIRTIEDTEEIEYDSESSNDEADQDLVKPKTKEEKANQNKKVCADFDESYVPVFNQKEYMKDTWSEVSAYIRKKAKTTLRDKIAQVRKQRIDAVEKNNSDTSDNENDSEEASDNEDWDEVKSKPESKKKNKKVETDEEKSQGMVKIVNEDNQEYFDFDESATFQSMNLSRPLLKAIDSLNWGHPTPIQAATIPTG